MGIRIYRRDARTRYIDGLKTRIQILEAENKSLKQENILLMADLNAYDQMKDQIKDLEAQYLQGVHDARNMIAECRKMISTSKATHCKYTKQMRGFLKKIR